MFPGSENGCVCQRRFQNSVLREGNATKGGGAEVLHRPHKSRENVGDFPLAMTPILILRPPKTLQLPDGLEEARFHLKK